MGCVVVVLVGVGWWLVCGGWCGGWVGVVGMGWVVWGGEVGVGVVGGGGGVEGVGGRGAGVMVWGGRAGGGDGRGWLRGVVVCVDKKYNKEKAVKVKK